MSPTFYRTHTRDDGETEVEIEINVVNWGEPQTRDHPGCGPEVEILQAHALNADGSHAEEVELTAAERARMELDFLENPPEPDDDYDG